VEIKNQLMMPETDEFIPPGALLHDTLNHVSSILSIAQFCLISKEVPPEVQGDLKRIIEMTREVAANLKRLAETLEEEED
jgi:signal transduction histidine kinase